MSLETNASLKEVIDKAEQIDTDLQNKKQLIATAVTGKDVPTNGSDSFQTMADNIDSIKTKLPIFEGDVGVTEDVEGNVYGVLRYKNTQVYDSVNNRYTKIWEYAVNLPMDVYIDNEGYVYICSDKVYKVNPLGELVWSYTINTSLAVKVDTEGYVYIGGNGKVTKLNSDGIFVWDFTLYNVNSIEIDNEGYIYACGGTWNSGGRAAKISPIGEKVWEYPLPSSAKSISLDTKGNVYLFGVRKNGNSADGDIIKLGNEGTLLWKYGFYYSEDLTVDSEGNVYATGSISSSIKGTLKIDTDGKLIWSNSESSRGLSIDKYDNLYISDVMKVSKKSKNYGFIWDFSETLDNYSYVANSSGLCCLASRTSSNGKIVALKDNYTLEKLAILKEREVQ